MTTGSARSSWCLVEPFVPNRNLVILRTHFVDRRLSGFCASVAAASGY